MSPTCRRCLSLFHFSIYSLWDLVRFFFSDLDRFVWNNLWLYPVFSTHPGCVFEIYKMKITLLLSVSWILTLNMLRFLIFISLFSSLICQKNPPNILFILADDLGDFLCTPFLFIIRVKIGDNFLFQSNPPCTRSRSETFKKNSTILIL